MRSALREFCSTSLPETRVISAPPRPPERRRHEHTDSLCAPLRPDLADHGRWLPSARTRLPDLSGSRPAVWRPSESFPPPGASRGGYPSRGSRSGSRTADRHPRRIGGRRRHAGPLVPAAIPRLMTAAGPACLRRQRHLQRAERRRSVRNSGSPPVASYRRGCRSRGGRPIPCTG